jgi:hypothetical protein
MAIHRFMALGELLRVGGIPHRCQGGRLLSNFGDSGSLKQNHPERVERGTLESPHFIYEKTDHLLATIIAIPWRSPNVAKSLKSFKSV